MIAKNDNSFLTQALNKPDRLQIFRTSIDQISYEPELVMLFVKMDVIQERHEIIITPLNITYGVYTHKNSAEKAE